MKSHVYYCVTCRKLTGKLAEQKMTDLPKKRSSDVAHFTYVGMDIFGTFVAKERRKKLKRYDAFFTCLACRAIHLEVVN